MKIVAVAMMKNEADIVVASVLAMAAQVDEVLVLDHGSTDGTRDLLAQLPCRVFDETDPGYYQSLYVSRLAEVAYDDGADWIIPFDADEVWESRCGDEIAEQLSYAHDRGADIVQAALFDHLATATDDPCDRNPLTRLRWRRRDPVPLPKVAVRAQAGLVIAQGNHGARAGRDLTVGIGWPLGVRHFSNRSPEQFIAKVRAGAAAYAATDLPDGMGAHWRTFGAMTDDELHAHFCAEMYVTDPEHDPSLVWDPWGGPT